MHRGTALPDDQRQDLTTVLATIDQAAKRELEKLGYGWPVQVPLTLTARRQIVDLICGVIIDGSIATILILIASLIWGAR